MLKSKKLSLFALTCAVASFSGIVPANAQTASQPEPKPAAAHAQAQSVYDNTMVKLASGATMKLSEVKAGDKVASVLPSAGATNVVPAGANADKGFVPAQDRSSTATPLPKLGTGATSPFSSKLMAGSWRAPGVPGMDVSGYQPYVNWTNHYNAGVRFAYIKATEGTGFTSDTFSSQYIGATNVGIARGGYHYALPSVSSGAAQADFFIKNGGGWSADGRTLPGLVDMEYNPYSSLGNTCYNMSGAQLSTWLRSFSDRYRQVTGRFPAIYTNHDWWTTCMGTPTQFANQPLHIAAYSTWVGYMPNGWSTYDMWQYSESGPFDGDSNAFQGTEAQLKNFVVNANYKPAGGFAPAVSAPSQPSIAIDQRIVNAYNALGGSARFGAPVATAFTQKSPTGITGTIQRFGNNNYIISSPKGSFVLRGAIGTKALATYKVIGFPLGNEITGLKTGGATQVFENATVTYSGATGAHYIKGAIRGKWLASGAQNSVFGYPTTDESCGLKGGGCQNLFGSRAIVWSPTTNAQVSTGSIRTTWVKNGAQNGRLGYPKTGEVSWNTNFLRQDYQGGYITWDRRNGAVKVVFN